MLSDTRPFTPRPRKTPAATLVLDAMRLAERAHRQGNHFRKAPAGEDRPAYFLHLSEVAWMLQEAALDAETVAAGYLHDIIEDCGYTERRLTREIGSARVASLVEWVSELDRRLPWETRNRQYLKRMQSAPPEVRALSCADKTSNLRDMVRLFAKGHPPESFTSKDFATQLRKFQALDPTYRGHVPEVLYARFRAALDEFAHLGGVVEPGG